MHLFFVNVHFITDTSNSYQAQRHLFSKNAFKVEYFCVCNHYIIPPPVQPIWHGARGLGSIPGRTILVVLKGSKRFCFCSSIRKWLGRTFSRINRLNHKPNYKCIFLIENETRTIFAYNRFRQKCTPDRFSILDQAANISQLKIKEAIHILWEKPSLNHQLAHVNLKLSL